MGQFCRLLYICGFQHVNQFLKCFSPRTLMTRMLDICPNWCVKQAVLGALTCYLVFYFISHSIATELRRGKGVLLKLSQCFRRSTSTTVQVSMP